MYRLKIQPEAVSATFHTPGSTRSHTICGLTGKHMQSAASSPKQKLMACEVTSDSLTKFQNLSKPISANYHHSPIQRICWSVILFTESFPSTVSEITEAPDGSSP